MSDKSAIQWTDATWNPVTGCSKVSPGCAHCYAETLSLRFGWSQGPWTPENASENVILHAGSKPDSSTSCASAPQINRGRPPTAAQYMGPGT